MTPPGAQWPGAVAITTRVVLLEARLNRRAARSGAPGKRRVFVRLIRRTEAVPGIAGLRQDVVRVRFKRSQRLRRFGCQRAFAGHLRHLRGVPGLAREARSATCRSATFSGSGVFGARNRSTRPATFHLLAGRVEAQYGTPHEFADADAKAVGGAGDRKFLRGSDKNNDAFAGFGSRERLAKQGWASPNGRYPAREKPFDALSTYAAVRQTTQHQCFHHIVLPSSRARAHIPRAVLRTLSASSACNIETVVLARSPR